ncbi:nitrate- and nitrite sensing domain-containing protein [Streptomyces sp. HUCO-GS316]|uniref:nitrate- and nitrite sensing domain-containing protein n=1 Tax=Streptomyces sp. HUCO-GS316 TaxID=2692198 RepID=UPI00301E1E81
MTVVFAVPTCLLLVMLGLAVDGRAEALGDARTTRAEVDLSLRIQGLVHQLQRERGLTNGLLGGAGGYRAQLAGQRDRADSARAGLRAESTVADALHRLDRLTAVRADVDSGQADRAATLHFYTAAITALNAEDPATDTATRGDRQLRNSLAALQELAAAKESIALERGSLNGVFAAGAFHGQEYLDFTEVRGTRVAALTRYRQVATPEQRSALDKAFATSAAKRAAAIERQAEGGVDGSALRVDPPGWWNAMTTLVDDLYAVQQHVGADTRARAEHLTDTAAAGLGGYLALGLLVASLVAAAAILASRSIARPLDALAAEADSVARHRLPHAVEAIQEAKAESEHALLPPAAEKRTSSNAQEIAKVVDALHNVERTAVGLAAEQALLRRNTSESLANLGRRNQGLVRRQLRLITALESQELDPDALAELFALDHLATRMRRNAESLLVLVGEPTPRPGTVTASGREVVQSALAEVEQYQRVVVADVEHCWVLGPVVADLAHLLAELIENALTFSPPHEPVDVHGWADGEDYCIAVVDHGIGLSAADLERCNARLAGDEAFLVAPTRFLGHYVVGQLARRLNVEVRLFDTPSGGVSALVSLPPRLLAAAAEPERRHLPAPAASTPQHVSSLLNGFRAGVARGETRQDTAS